MAKVALNMDVFRSDADVVDGLAIHGCKPRRTLDGILELHVIDQNGDDLDADVDREHCEGDEADELEAAGAPLRSACRKPLLASQETMPIALPGACKASESH